MKRLRKTWLAASLAACFIAGGVVWAALDASAPKVDLAAWAPQGALLSLETEDFSTLLEDWTSSPEKTAWIKSDDYAVFSRSRLFGRLQDAQKEFADAAGAPVDGDLLKEVAGRQSFFAWYDIGGLQIVYMTRMTPAQVSQSRLWQRRKDFDTRQAGGVTFYVKTGEAASSDMDASNDVPATKDAGADSDESNSAEKKTVAFAQSGDWLVLATGEDLMAQTLELMAAKDHAGADSLAQQAWYKEAKAAAAGAEGDLRMVLDMERVVKTPQFRTYWIQQNVTDMKQYKSVVANLYRDAGGMREERVLLPKSEVATTDVDLGQITALVPDRTVVYRATAKPTAVDALAALQTKVLDRGVGSYEDTTVAPVAALDVPQAGSVADLETRIDEPAVATVEKPGSVTLLAKVLQDAALEGMMTVDRNSADGKADGIWTPFASAVVLSSGRDWDVHVMQEALQQLVQAKLTVGALGVAWQQRTSHGTTYFAMNEANGVQLYIDGHICIVADDAGLLMDMLQKQSLARSAKVQPAMMLSGFDHSVARVGFAQWTAVVDGLLRRNVATSVTSAAGATADQAPDETPPFFGKDIKSLSDAFAAMKNERFVAKHDGALVRQTITYAWLR
jgi:hypothetical protein